MLQTIAERGRALTRPDPRPARGRPTAVRDPHPALRRAAVRSRRGVRRGARGRNPGALWRAQDRLPHRLLRGAGEPLRARSRAARSGRRRMARDLDRRCRRRHSPRLGTAPARIVAAPQPRAARHRRTGAHAQQLLDAIVHRDDLAIVDNDFVHLFSSWFNRGFLVLRRIDWSTPASILEKIIRYEAVHAIRDWNDLRARIDSSDRRCYAFFHPALDDEPLIFVEVALTARHSGGNRADPRRASREESELERVDDRRVLFDLQLPARPRRRVVRQFPHQAGR